MLTILTFGLRNEIYNLKEKKMKCKLIAAAAVLLSLTLSAPLAFASGGGPVTAAEPLGVEKDATSFTQEINKDLLKVLPFKDSRDFENAQKGFIARGESVIKDGDGNIIFSTKEFDFMQDLKKKAESPCYGQPKPLASDASG
jgi:alkyl sulfatase BDS1-like metallo-beta-lactamase superfamily hydrolase